MNAHDPASASEDSSSEAGDEAPPFVHTGHDLETGLLARAREWMDVLPWLRLVRVLRVAGSPPLLGLVAITLAIWLSVASRIAPQSPPVQQFAAMRPIDNSANKGLIASATANSLAFVEASRGFVPTSLFGTAPRWRSVAAIVWTLLIWTPVILLLLRQGALLCAGRDLADLRVVVSHALRRTPSAWLVALLPLICVGALGLALLIAGRIEAWIGGFGVLQLPVALLLLLFAIPCGLLAFGASFAVPLGWSAVANEDEADALNALSRGYEYLYRRPLQLVLYAVVSFVPLLVIAGLSGAIAVAAMQVSATMIGSIESGLFRALAMLLSYLPVVATLTLGWGLVGGIYLLVRQDANEQEPEDIWLPQQPTEPLPELPGQHEIKQLP